MGPAADLEQLLLEPRARAKAFTLGRAGLCERGRSAWVSATSAPTIPSPCERGSRRVVCRAQVTADGGGEAFDRDRERVLEILLAAGERGLSVELA